MSCLVLSCCESRADVSIAISAAEPDANGLVVGQKATFLVELSGLQGGQKLDYLAATVLYDGGLLGAPAIFPGSIIPDPLSDPRDFMTFSDSGTADATFMTFSSATAGHIAATGTFISFEVIAQAVGSGSLCFDYVDATAFNAADPASSIQLSPIAGPALDFTVHAVPEPTAIACLMSSCVYLAFVGIIFSRNERGFIK